MIKLAGLAGPVLPAASGCVADSARVASVDSAVVRVSVHVPEVQAAVAGTVAAPATDGVTVATSSANVPHVPPIEVTFTFVEYGNDRVTPLTCVTATDGAVLSMIK